MVSTLHNQLGWQAIVGASMEVVNNVTDQTIFIAFGSTAFNLLEGVVDQGKHTLWQVSGMEWGGVG